VVSWGLGRSPVERWLGKRSYWWRHLLMANLIVSMEFSVRYTLAASDCQWPRILTSSEEWPAEMAEFVTAHRREWPEHLEALGIPAWRRVSEMFLENHCLLKGPTTRSKKGLDWWCGYFLTGCWRARTRHEPSLAKDVYPFSGLVCLGLRRCSMTPLEVNLTEFLDMYVAGCHLSQVISPTLKKPANATQNEV
jgi:hypothetical protein